MLKCKRGCSSKVERQIEALRDGGASPSGPTKLHPFRLMIGQEFLKLLAVV